MYVGIYVYVDMYILYQIWVGARKWPRRLERGGEERKTGSRWREGQTHFSRKCRAQKCDSRLPASDLVVQLHVRFGSHCKDGVQPGGRRCGALARSSTAIFLCTREMKFNPLFSEIYTNTTVSFFTPACTHARKKSHDTCLQRVDCFV